MEHGICQVFTSDPTLCQTGGVPTADSCFQVSNSATYILKMLVLHIVLASTTWLQHISRTKISMAMSTACKQSVPSTEPFMAAVKFCPSGRPCAQHAQHPAQEAHLWHVSLQGEALAWH